MTTRIKSTSLKYCPECDETIRVGVDITRNQEGHWIHLSCFEELNSSNNKKSISPEDFWNLEKNI